MSPCIQNLYTRRRLKNNSISHLMKLVRVCYLAVEGCLKEKEKIQSRFVISHQKFFLSLESFPGQGKQFVRLALPLLSTVERFVLSWNGKIHYVRLETDADGRLFPIAVF